MSPVCKKLNLKEQTEVVVNAPPAFEGEMRDLKVSHTPKAVEEMTFALAVVTKQKELNELAHSILQKIKGDAVIWFANPKKTSMTYTFEIDRDHRWDSPGDLGFETVRMGAIDEDWTAKRVRRAEYIKGLNRDEAWAMGPGGKEKARKK